MAKNTRNLADQLASLSEKGRNEEFRSLADNLPTRFKRIRQNLWVERVNALWDLIWSVCPSKELFPFIEDCDSSCIFHFDGVKDKVYLKIRLIKTGVRSPFVGDYVAEYEWHLDKESQEYASCYWGWSSSIHKIGLAGKQLADIEDKYNG